ncbi:alpha-xenorhabdolysin family binary toxin subunit A [Pseudomonas citri]|uniref:alpha-xenorhabdolysin family binary toxin subunit A n=1 Tax=Pseudomonas citri TaxID=2978349 RepID=UPI0021B56A58|nr:alpha-xenorhabdolysin family binary toxin subunit A [Pseudomonas citri]
MSSNALWDDALNSASPDDITRFAQLAPKTLSNASAPEREGESRGKGLLLTKKQIIDLRKYEAAALALPFTLNDVKDYLNFGDAAGGGVGLKADDFLKTFSATRRHAQRWSPLREAIMLTGSQLKLFAASMLTYGEAMEEVYAEVRTAVQLDQYQVNTLEQLKRLELQLGDKFLGVEVDPEDLEDLGSYLEKIFDHVERNLKSVSDIKVSLATFGYDLRVYILPEIKFRLDLIGSSSLPVEVNMLKQQIDERAVQIGEKNAAYKAAVEKSIGAAAGLNLVGLALAIYLGVEAENIRADRNRLYKEQEEALETLKAKNQTLGSLSRVKHDLQGLELVAVDADIATQNLMHVWNVMHLYLQSSQEAVAGITDALRLRQFMSAFREVVRPWKQIETDADALIAVFKEADAEYERVYGNRPRFAGYTALPAGYPSVDLNLMAESGAQVRESAVHSLTLFTQWNYLPALHERFSAMARDVSTSTGVLSHAALSTKIKLEVEMGRLEMLEKELANEEDEQEIADIQADRAKALDSIGTLLGQSTRQLSSQLSAIDDTFDRRLTLGFIDDLEKEQRAVEVVLVQLKQEHAEGQDKRRVLSEAINALKQSGIEQIGNDLLLTVEEVTKLGVAPPQVQLVMFAVEQLKKTLGQVGEGLRFLDLLRQRDKVVEGIQALARDIELKDVGLAALKGKVEFLQIIHTLDDQRRRYVGEYQRAVRGFQLFAEQAKTGSQAELAEHRTGFINRLRQFIAFLEPLSLPLAPR